MCCSPYFYSANHIFLWNVHFCHGSSFRRVLKYICFVLYLFCWLTEKKWGTPLVCFEFTLYFNLYLTCAKKWQLSHTHSFAHSLNLHSTKIYFSNEKTIISAAHNNKCWWWKCWYCHCHYYTFVVFFSSLLHSCVTFRVVWGDGQNIHLYIDAFEHYSHRRIYTVRLYYL